MDKWLEVVKLKQQGLSDREVEAATGVPKSTVNDLMNRRSNKAQVWWAEHEDKLAEESELDALVNSPDWHIANLAKRLRTAQRTNTQLRRALNSTTDAQTHIPEMIKAVEEATKNLRYGARTFENTHIYEDKSAEVIYEILLSDYQIGKKGQCYNSHLAERAMQKYGHEILKKIKQDSKKINKIVLALMGDLVEDHMKHGVQSATSTDSGLAEQMVKAISHLWDYIVHPLALLGVELEVVCIAGNHGSSQHKGMDMYKAGLYSYDYVIYKTLEGYCKVAGYSKVKFIIPEGCFGYTNIFGRYVVYEHGYKIGCDERSLEAQRAKRANQLKRHLEYFRIGDKHHVCNYDNGSLVVNGAFFGVDNTGEEYSGILGFNSIPAQVMFVHKEDRSLGRNTIKETIVVQVADGY